jgi:uncharacterized protein YidB (DUF937 family)
MGLLDGSLGNALGSALGANGGETAPHNILAGILDHFGDTHGKSNPLLTTVMSLVQQHGGLSGISERFRSNGFGKAIDSWVGPGANLPVKGEDMNTVFGAPMMKDMAEHLGTSQEEATGALANLLPELVDKLTPDGMIPANSSDLLTQGIAMIKKFT